MPRGRRVALAVAGFVTSATLGGCTGLEDCVSGGPSVVELRLPSSSWELSEFCIDDECLAETARQPAPAADDGPESELVFYSYVVEVGDTPDTYRYRFDVTAPDGRSFARDGEVSTAGNTSGGERCNPTWSTASITVDDDGDVTVQSP
jgi:hypothetical protein